MEIHFLLTLLLVVNLMHNVRSSVFTINNCPFNIASGTLTNPNSRSSIITGFELAPQASKTINVPPTWQGRIWARFQCSNAGGKFSCKSSDGDSGQVECNGAGGAPPTTLAEFSLSGSSGKDYYDVSLIDGFNVPISIVSQGGCPISNSPVDINARCKPELAVKDGSGGTTGSTSACLAFNKPGYCCNGDHDKPETCSTTDYSKFFKNLCPKAYSYAYDDPSSTFTCQTGANYAKTFCL